VPPPLVYIYAPTYTQICLYALYTITLLQLFKICRNLLQIFYIMGSEQTFHKVYNILIFRITDLMPGYQLSHTLIQVTG
jgi:hypothetical protein